MKTASNKKSSVILIGLMILSLVLCSCVETTTPAPTQDVGLIETQAAQTVVADFTQNAPPVSTQAPPATTIPTQAPPPGPTPEANIPVAMLPTPAPGEATAIANYNTVIYSGPGSNYVVYGAFLGGTPAKVVGKSDNSLWWVISVPVAPDGNGWVDAGWVKVSNVDNVPVIPTPPIPPTTDLVPPGANDPQATIIASTYVRSGPATNFPAYGAAPVGATARVIGVSEDSQWWVIRINPQKVGIGYGWVLAQYTSAKNVDSVPTIVSPQASYSSPPPTPAPGAPSGTVTTAVNVRSGPGTNYPILVVAPAGSSGEITGKSADGLWWQVKISTQYSANGLGWVAAGFGYTQNTENVPVVAAPPAPPVVQPTPSAIVSTGCLLISQNPSDGTVYNQGDQFNTTWVLKNTGTNNWDQNKFDIVYVGALNNSALHEGPDRYDLTITVEPNWTYNFWLPMLAPYDSGYYGEMWQISSENQTVCQFWVYIFVK